MTNITKLSNKSWLLKNKNNVILGLLSKKDDEKYQLFTTNSKIDYDSIDEVEREFGELSEIVMDSKSTNVKNINGYPVRHENITIIDEKSVLYSKGTKVYFVAGYWAVKGENGWSMLYCPKHSTIKSSEHIGPYRNKMEILNEISMRNNSEKLVDINNAID